MYANLPLLVPVGGDMGVFGAVGGRNAHIHCQWILAVLQDSICTQIR